MSRTVRREAEPLKEVLNKGLQPDQDRLLLEKNRLASRLIPWEVIQCEMRVNRWKPDGLIVYDPNNWLTLIISRITQGLRGCQKTVLKKKTMMLHDFILFNRLINGINCLSIITLLWSHHYCLADHLVLKTQPNNETIRWWTTWFLCWWEPIIKRMKVHPQHL